MSTSESLGAAGAHVAADAALPRINGRRLGVPYGRVAVDARGHHVTCPVCGERFYAPARARTEVAITKGAAAAYALHFDAAVEAGR